MTYCTLDDVKDELKGDATRLTAADTRWLQRHLRVVSDQAAKVSAGMGYDLEPWYKAKSITARPTNVSSVEKILQLPDPLLEIVSVTSDGTALTENTDLYAEPLGRWPIRALRIDPDVCTSWWPCNCDPYNTISITGYWGYRRRYDTDGFLSVDVLAAAIVSTSVTTFTVVDADGADYYGITPRFSVGALIRVDSELMEVTGVDTTTNTLTVIRGVRGSTAATHLISTAVKFWSIEPEIRHVAARHVGLMYARRGAYTAIVTEFGSTSYPADLLSEMRAALGRLQYA